MRVQHTFRRASTSRGKDDCSRAVVVDRRRLIQSRWGSFQRLKRRLGEDPKARSDRDVQPRVRKTFAKGHPHQVGRWDGHETVGIGRLKTAQQILAPHPGVDQNHNRPGFQQSKDEGDEVSSEANQQHDPHPGLDPQLLQPGGHGGCAQFEFRETKRPVLAVLPLSMTSNGAGQGHLAWISRRHDPQSGGYVGSRFFDHHGRTDTHHCSDLPLIDPSPSDDTNSFTDDMQTLDRGRACGGWACGGGALGRHRQLRDVF